MKNINKTKFIIIGIYLIHLVLFIILSYFTNSCISQWIEICSRLKIPLNISYYNHIYIILYYTIFSTYSMVKALNIYINKIVGILIIIVANLFALIGIYIFGSFKYSLNSLTITTGLIISLNAIYRKIKISEPVK